MIKRVRHHDEMKTQERVVPLPQPRVLPFRESWPPNSQEMQAHGVGQFNQVSFREFWGANAEAAATYQAACAAALAVPEEWVPELEALVDRIYLTEGSPAPHVLGFVRFEVTESTASVCLCTGTLLASRVAASVCLVDSVGGARGERETDAADANAIVTRMPGSDLLRLNGRLPLRDRKSVSSFASTWDCIRHVRTCIDYILVDAAVARGGRNVTGLARSVDAVVLVLTACVTSRKATLRVIRDLEAAGVAVLGAVLIDA
jgi:hypothetical protein